MSIDTILNRFDRLDELWARAYTRQRGVPIDGPRLPGMEPDYTAMHVFLTEAHALTREVERRFVPARAGIISHSTSDFTAILADTMGKSMQRGLKEAPETYAAWTTPGEKSS